MEQQILDFIIKERKEHGLKVKEIWQIRHKIGAFVIQLLKDKIK